jgi:exonuclease VII small subunit
VAGLGLPAGPVLVKWFQGFEIVAPRPDQPEGEETVRVMDQQLIPLEEACKRLEDASKQILEEAIKHKQQQIAILHKEVSQLVSMRE